MSNLHKINAAPSAPSQAEPAAAASLCLAIVEQLDADRAVVRIGDRTIEAKLGAVDQALVARCHHDSKPVVVALQPEPRVVGCLQTKLDEHSGPQKRLEFEAGESVRLRAGKSALILHADGTVELRGERLKFAGAQVVDIASTEVKLP